jgi:hypothetical protein
MKAFSSVVVVRQPLDRVWGTMRDRLPELGAALDDIESITVIEREDLGPGSVRLVNEWRSSQAIPAVLRDRIGASGLSWLDRNNWDDSSHCCTWVIEPAVFTEHIRCTGSTRYEPAMGGRGTRVTFAGTFDLAPGALATSAGSLQRPAAAFIESIATAVIPRNVRKVIEAAARLIEQDCAG